MIVFCLMLLSTSYDIIHTVSNRKYTWSFRQLWISHIKSSDRMRVLWSLVLLLISLLWTTGEKSQALLAFSVYSNGIKLLSHKKAKSPGMMHCLHGIRAISTQWVVLTHTYFIHMLLPMRNKSFLLTVRILDAQDLQFSTLYFVNFSLRRNTLTW